jgi:hypothetical protein
LATLEEGEVLKLLDLWKLEELVCEEKLLINVFLAQTKIGYLQGESISSRAVP